MLEASAVDAQAMKAGINHRSDHHVSRPAAKANHHAGPGQDHTHTSGRAAGVSQTIQAMALAMQRNQGAHRHRRGGRCSEQLRGAPHKGICVVESACRRADVSIVVRADVLYHPVSHADCSGMSIQLSGPLRSLMRQYAVYSSINVV